MASLTISEWTNFASTLFAAVAALFSAIGIYISRQTVARQVASDSVKKYFELSLEYPELSTLKKSDMDDWFVSFLLIAAQDVLLAYKTDPHRKNLMKYQLGLYRPILIEWEKYDRKHKTNHLKEFGAEVEDLVRQVIREGAPA
jgi:hypothetical protein